MGFHAITIPTMKRYTTPDIYNIQERYMSDEKKPDAGLPEWISTGQAAELLELKSTQAIRDFIDAGTITQWLDIGTDKRPRFVVNRDEIMALAEKRKAQ